MKQKISTKKPVAVIKKNRVSQLISELCMTLRAHIEKENNILYPMALQCITDDKKWEEMKIKCDDIGYCCFCPTEMN